MLEDWDRRFPSCKPVGHLLRERLPERWVRFHSLPESKRCPDSEAEFDELLARHNAVVGELTGERADVVLVTTTYSGSPVAKMAHPDMLARDPAASYWQTLAMHEVDPGNFIQSYWHLYAEAFAWQPGKFDTIVRDVAVADLANVLIVAPDCSWVVFPYDGGMDVVADSPKTLTMLRNKYADWLSKLRSGM